MHSLAWYGTYCHLSRRKLPLRLDVILPSVPFTRARCTVVPEGSVNVPPLLNQSFATPHGILNDGVRDPAESTVFGIPEGSVVVTGRVTSELPGFGIPSLGEVSTEFTL